MFVCFFGIIFLLNIKLIIAQTPSGDMLIGDWTDSKKEIVITCFKKDGKYYAKPKWIENLEHPGNPLPKEERCWLNILVMKDFEFDSGENEWSNGTIHDPKTNKTYTAFISYIDKNRITITGFVWFRFLSESENFTKVITN